MISLDVGEMSTSANLIASGTLCCLQVIHIFQEQTMALAKVSPCYQVILFLSQWQWNYYAPADESLIRLSIEEDLSAVIC